MLGSLLERPGFFMPTKYEDFGKKMGVMRHQDRGPIPGIIHFPEFLPMSSPIYHSSRRKTKGDQANALLWGLMSALVAAGAVFLWKKRRSRA